MSYFRDIPGLRLRRGLCLALALACASADGAKITERSQQKAVAEAQRAGLQEKLSALKRDIGRTESAKDDAADTLAESEEAISNADRSLHELAGEQTQTSTKMQQLAQERDRLRATAELQKKQLATMLRQQYMAGNEDRIKLLLSGDNPNRINRDLQMMAYVSQAQAKLLSALRGNLLAVEANQQQAQNAKDELEEITLEQRQQKAVLEQEKVRRAAVLGTLSSRLAAQRTEVGKVARDEQRMAGLVDKLGQLIQQQAAAAAAAQKRLQEQLALARAKAEIGAKLARAKAEAEAKLVRAEAERERLVKQSSKSGQIKPPTPFKKPLPARPEQMDAEAPKMAQQKLAEPKPLVADEPSKAVDVVGLAPVLAEGAFARLRGQLRAPVAGKMGARFGSKRGDGPSWKGVFIRAAEGSEVKAIAPGRVVFAEWLRGFGNLIIVDHGGQYMSIYGNNQALLKRAGDAVKGGDPIASAGNSGGNEESGLYFELRHQGRAFDPSGWVKF